MTSDTTPTSKLDDAEPIDVDFTPAADKDPATKRAGPGWLALLMMGLMSAGLGAIIAILVRGNAVTPEMVDNVELISELEAVKAELDAAELKTNKLERDTAELETRLTTKLTAQTNSAENSAELTALVAELERVSTRLDDAMAASGTPEAVTDILQRLETLEQAGGNQDATPADIQRAIATLDQRVNTFETRIDTLEANQTSTQTSLQALKTELDSLRASGLAASQQSTEDAGKIADLIASFDEKETQLQSHVETAESATKAALALSSIEAASRRGQSFQVDFANLKAALPDNPALNALAPLASKNIPTLADLKATYQTLQTETEREIAADSSGSLGWVNRVFGDAVNIRRKTDATDAVTQALDAASAALAKDDLPAAVNAVAPVLTSARWADWTKQANQRITLEKALDDLRLNLIGVERAER